MFGDIVVILAVLWDLNFNLASKCLHFAFGGKMTLITLGKRIRGLCVVLLLEKLHQEGTIGG
jgi:hypothetical protein